MEQPVSALERIESLKAGSLGAIAFTLTYLITMVINYSLWGQDPLEIVSFGLKIAIALVSGFLFAVTYRYIIRRDRNSHLKDGAVLAFGLVRGLVPVEMSANFIENLAQLCLLGFESIVCFSIARFTLDWAFHRLWIKPFS